LTAAHFSGKLELQMDDYTAHKMARNTRDWPFIGAICGIGFATLCLLSIPFAVHHRYQQQAALQYYEVGTRVYFKDSGIWGSIQDVNIENSIKQSDLRYIIRYLDRNKTYHDIEALSSQIGK
jgi:hypothetical protein